LGLQDLQHRQIARSTQSGLHELHDERESFDDDAGGPFACMLHGRIYAFANSPV
jgi:hypothetical protein